MAEKLPDLTGLLTGFTFESSAFNQQAAAQSSRIVRKEGTLRPASAYLN